jgi:hypothetical protein
MVKSKKTEKVADKAETGKGQKKKSQVIILKFFNRN